MAPQLYNKIRHAVRYWLLGRLPTCKELAPVISQSLERRLTLRERVVLKIHLLICVWCSWYLQQLRLTRDMLRTESARISDDRSSSAPSLSTEARDRIKRALARKEQ